MTKQLYEDVSVRQFKAFEFVARRKLFQIATALKLDDLKSPSGNRLERLKGNRREQYSIRINDQFRICFEWYDGNAGNVEIVDYHQ